MLVRIYGQTKADDSADAPPPPKVQREAPPPAPALPRQGFFNRVHLRFEVVGPGLHIEFGNGGVQIHRAQPGIILATILLIWVTMNFFRPGPPLDE
jgi:hypothetical protein